MLACLHHNLRFAINNTDISVWNFKGMQTELYSYMCVHVHACVCVNTLKFTYETVAEQVDMLIFI